MTCLITQGLGACSGGEGGGPTIIIGGALSASAEDLAAASAHDQAFARISDAPQRAAVVTISAAEAADSQGAERGC